MEKIAKEIKSNLFKNYNINIGTLDVENAKSIFITISAWLKPKQDGDINYNRVIRDLNKTLKQTLHNYLNNGDLLITERTIIDLDIRESGINFDRKSYMGCELTFFSNEYINIDNPSVINRLNRIINLVIKDVFNKNTYFDFHRTKK